MNKGVHHSVHIHIKCRCGAARSDERLFDFTGKMGA